MTEQHTCKKMEGSREELRVQKVLHTKGIRLSVGTNVELAFISVTGIGVCANGQVIE